VVHLIVGADDEAVTRECLNPITRRIEAGEEQRFVDTCGDAGWTVHRLAIAGAVEEYPAR